MPAPASDLAVQTNALCRRYGRRWALVDVTFELPRGATLLLAGRNGSGKSTLLRVLAGALRPDRGRVHILGHDAIGAREALRRKTALLAHQSFTYDALSARQNLELVARVLGKPASRAAIDERLAAVGLDGREDDPVDTFSAGMRRRLAFARLLVQEPAVVLLDEPYAQLDPPGFLFVDRLIGSLRARGAAVIMASHLLERGASLCERGLVLEAGRVAWSGPAASLPRDGGLALGSSLTEAAS